MKITGTNLPGKPSEVNTTGSEIQDAIIKQLVKEVTSNSQMYGWEVDVVEEHCWCCNKLTTIKLKLGEDTYIGNGFYLFNLPDLDGLVNKITEPYINKSGGLTEFSLKGGPKFNSSYQYEVEIHRFQ